MRYYSDLLDKTFDTVKELEEAETSKVEAEKRMQEEKEKLQASRKVLAHEVEEAYKHYIEVIESNSKKLEALSKQIEIENKEACNEYLKLRNEFIGKYGSFHMTYKDNTPVVDTVTSIKPITFSEVFNDMFDLFKLLK